MAQSNADSPIQMLDWALLDLDPLNPRLIDQSADDPQPLTQSEAAEALMDEHDPISIGRSMSRFGFFPSDPLIAYADGERYVVVEGNRRLLALRLLLGDDVVAFLVDDAWRSLSSEIASHVRPTLETVPVHVVADRDEAAPVIGFRHIVGIKKWDAYEKAAFVRRLIVSQSSKGMSDDEVFERVSMLTGESPTRIRTYLRDYVLLRQAEAAGIDVQNAREEFGVFTRALSSKGVRSFMQAKAASDMTVDMERAYDAADEQVREVLGWMHGPDPVFTDARKLKQFGKVLDAPEAVEHLRRTRNLEEAEALSGAVRDRVLSNAQKALSALRLVEPDVARIDTDETVLGLLRRIADLADSLAASSPTARPATADAEEVKDAGGYDLTEDDDDADQDSDDGGEGEQPADDGHPDGYDLTSDEDGATDG